MKGITVNLWFEDQAEEAANFYVSTFSKLDGGTNENTKVEKSTRYSGASAEAGGRPEGSVMTVDFRIHGQEFVGLNGGPEFQFTEAISLIANCETQEEIDYLWETLSDGGEEGVCGWLKDRYGVSWQVVPTTLSELLADPDRSKGERVMQALLQMKKLDTEELRRAADQAVG